MGKILIISFLILATGCKKGNPEDNQMINTRWILNHVQNTSTNATLDYPSDAQARISIIFTDSLNVILFSGICNNGTGTYTYSAKTGEIKVNNLMTTLIACNYVEWESYTTQNLIKAYRFKKDGNTLIIYSKGDYNLFFTK